MTSYQEIEHCLRATYQLVKRPGAHGFSFPLLAYSAELGIHPDHLRMALLYLHQQNRLLAQPQTNPLLVLEWWDVNFLDEHEGTPSTAPGAIAEAEQAAGAPPQGGPAACERG